MNSQLETDMVSYLFQEQTRQGAVGLPLELRWPSLEVKSSPVDYWSFSSQDLKFGRDTVIQEVLGS